jgi:AP2 domain
VKNVPLRGKYGEGFFALVDDADYDRVIGKKWHAKMGSSGMRYAYCNGVAMHTFLTGYKQTDHKNRDSLDNQQHNLREATAGQNSANRAAKGISKYLGVSWSGPRNSQWIASLKKDGHIYRLGGFRTEEEAARAYDRAAVKFHGEFANLNFPGEVEGK